MNVLFHGNVQNTAMLNRKGMKKIFIKNKNNQMKLFLAVRCVKFVQHL